MQLSFTATQSFLIHFYTGEWVASQGANTTFTSLIGERKLFKARRHRLALFSISEESTRFSHPLKIH